jgi:hypothetical protein
VGRSERRAGPTMEVDDLINRYGRGKMIEWHSAIFIIYEWRAFRQRASPAASASSHSRNIAILGSAAVAFGQTIQYVLDILKETSIGLTRRPLMRSQAASAVRASATPWPSTAASISMLALLRTGP